MQEQITGLFTKELYRNERNSYAMFVLESIKEKEIIKTVCAGKIQRVDYNTPVILTGQINIDEKERQVFCFSDYELKEDNIQESVCLLTSFKITGFGKEKALKTAEWFNYGIFNAVEDCKTTQAFEDRCPDDVKKYAKQIYTRVKRILTERELTKEIFSVGDNYPAVTMISKKYGEKALDVLRRNPYKIGFYAGLTFYECEQLAKRYKIPAFSCERTDGILLFAVDDNKKNGNAFMTIEELRKYTDVLQQKTRLHTPFDAVLATAILNDGYVIEDDKIYLKTVYAMEKSLAMNIMRIKNAAKQINEIDWQAVNEIENNEQIQFSVSQKEAFKALASEGIKLITGGPGTGKTTLINSLIKYLKEKYPDAGITMCAPTGRAAQNLAGKTECVAETIHKTLGLKPFSTDDLRVTKKMEDYIYIVDECSMLNLKLADIFFKSLPNHCIVLLVGDKDQLPCIDAGNVFCDLLHSNIEKYILSGVHRQNNDSLISINAELINAGEIALKSGVDFDIMRVNDEETAIRLCMMYTQDKDLQVLTPLSKSATGSRALSGKIQSVKTFQSNAIKVYGDTTYHIGDKVILLNNNYEADYFNGDIGTITEINEDYITILSDDIYDFDTGAKKEIEVENSNLHDVALSYAITIHKSQGGEYDEVIIVLTKSAYKMANRNLLYTAVTRAKKKVTIITQNDLLEQAILQKSPERNSNLCNLLV